MRCGIVARELHDRTSPNLASIGVHLNIITTDLQEGDASMLDERLADVRALIEDTTASIREICSDLRPPVLDYSGLQAALETFKSLLSHTILNCNNKQKVTINPCR